MACTKRGSSRCGVSVPRVPGRFCYESWLENQPPGEPETCLNPEFAKICISCFSGQKSTSSIATQFLTIERQTTSPYLPTPLIQESHQARRMKHLDTSQLAWQISYRKGSDLIRAADHSLCNSPPTPDPARLPHALTCQLHVGTKGNLRRVAFFKGDMVP